MWDRAAERGETVSADEQDMPPDTDMRIEHELLDGGGIRQVTITAHTEQAQIDLAMEYPRIVKLLSRDWLKEDE